MLSKNLLMTVLKNNLAIYIHWPFCKSKCPYCDFNSHVEKNIEHDKWLSAYLNEIEYFAEKLGKRNVGSIFFGGGTPSLMRPEVVQKILEKINNSFSVADNVEITLEANPTSIETEKLKSFKQAGVNRVSIGVQALNEKDLKFLGREHSPLEAKKALETAANIFENFSFDLIYCRPEQTIEAWKSELNEALKIADKHISLYQLTIEKGTEFYSKFNKKEFVMPEEKLSAEFFEETQNILKKRGLPSYEISNHAKAGFESKHNISYWEYDEYLGIGPGAHGRINLDGKRTATMMLYLPDNWLKAVSEKKHGLQNADALNDETILEEIVMMGLRLTKGLSFDKFKLVSGKDFFAVFNKEKIKFLENENLIEIKNSRLAATKKGALLLNSLTEKILSYKITE